MNKGIPKGKQAKKDTKAIQHLLDSISRVQSQFITDSNPHNLFEGFLTDLLSLTQSEYGFIGEILYTDKGDPYLKTHAITNIAWNEETRNFYRKKAPDGLEFYNVDTLVGAVMKTGKPVVANNPGTDPRGGGLPTGHPELRKFLGLPFHKGKKLVGMVGIANRPRGYDQKLVGELKPLLTTCANIIEAYRNDQNRLKAEDSLRIKTEQLKAVTDAMTAFLEKGDWKEVSAMLLRCALDLTSSEYGFAGVVVPGPILRVLAHEGLKWDKDLNRGFYEKAMRAYKEVGYLEFPNLENLFGRVITTGKVVMANHPGADPRSGGLPPGHPPLHHFLGVPIIRGTEVVGIIGVANRAGGYTGTEQSQIKILCQAAGVLYDSYRRKEREADLEEQRKRSEEMLAQLASFPELDPQPIIEVDLNGNIHYFNPKAARSIPDIEEEGFRHPFLLGLDALAGSLQKEENSTCGREVQVGDVWYEQVIHYVEKNKRIRVYARDITDRKQAVEALEEQAVRDSLTGLYNRRHFDYRIREEIARADRNQYRLAVLLCDLDQFKTVNDTQGHQSGDKVLKAVAEAIQDATRGTDMVFRWGGDEFAVILSNTTREGVIIVAERIRDKITKVYEKTKVSLDLSIGVAFYPEHEDSPDGLIRVADTALYIAKKGGDKIHIGTEEYQLDERSIKIVFQPVVAVQPIRNIRSEQVLGYEALSRDPEGKRSILELFARYRAIGKLHELKCICFKAQVKAAQEAGLEKVFINVDFNVLSEVELIPKPRNMEVILEISELEAIHDVENRLIVAKKWREFGYKFAIDDFGAGFISLPFIARLFPEYIKMDRSTLLQAVSSAQFKEFMIGMIFGLKNYSTEGIIAEGVETEEELKVVKEMGIFLIQGFLFGKPQEIKKTFPDKS